jgi:hypothetical protein
VLHYCYLGDLMRRWFYPPVFAELALSATATRAKDFEVVFPGLVVVFEPRPYK